MLSEIVSFIVAFSTTFFITPVMMDFLSSVGIVGRDMHKKSKPKLPTSGGVCVAIGLIAGLLAYIGLRTFLYNDRNLELLAVASSISLVMLIGLLDDMNVKACGERIGLPQWVKPLATLPAAIPLMVINAGVSRIGLPLIGSVDLGILYPLVAIPIGFVGATNMVNLLGGFNGSEAGMGIVYTFSLFLFALGLGNQSYVVFLLAFASLIAFIKYNWYPAKILPGDSLTYLLGAVVACGVIVGNMERVGIITMLPFEVEFILKLRSKFKASCLGKLRRDGKLDPPYGKNIYSWTHLIMNVKPMTEREVTLSLILIQALFAILPFLKL